MKNLSIFLILLWVFSAPLTQAQTARVIVESQDSAGWTYRGAVSSVKTPFSESEASLAEAFSNYTAPAFPMTHFAAYRGADSHQIHWTQGTPRQAFRVYVQRSADGESWTEIGMIKGEAGLKPLQDWAFSDPRPLPGPNYYRLRQVTVDGNSTNSDIIVVEPCPGGFHTTYLYPHPGIFGTMLEVTLIESQKIEVRILDENNQLVGIVYHESVANGSHKIEVDVTELPSGTYQCEIQIGEYVSRREIVR